MDKSRGTKRNLGERECGPERKRCEVVSSKKRDGNGITNIKENDAKTPKGNRQVGQAHEIGHADTK